LPLRTFVHVSGEVGIGAGLIMDGALYRGRHGFSGEIGHLEVRVERLPRDLARRVRPLCSCGRSGCLELYAGQDSVVAAAGLDPDRDGLPGLEREAAAGRRPALAALELAGTALGRAIATVVNVVDADTVVLGGVQARLARWTLPFVQAEVDRHAVVAGLHPVQVLVGALGQESASLGGATSVVRRIIADPAGYLAATTP
jgi:predicted NBD/HSP70 family sugar kinase